MKSVSGLKGIFSLFFNILVLAVILSLLGCHPALRQEVRDPEQALVSVRFFYPKFKDDLDVSSLAGAVRRNLAYLGRLPPDHVFRYGPDQFTCQQVMESQQAFLRILDENPDPRDLNKRIKKDFLVYRAAGRSGSRHVLFTGYFEPVYEGGLAPDEDFKYPLYRTPDDLITIDLSPFSGEFRGKSIIARIDGNHVRPYYARDEIEEKRVLAGKGLEIAWLKDPVDVAFLHIQGSGRLKLMDGGSLSVGYAGKNGRPFRSIGRYLLDEGLLSREEMSMQRIRRFFTERPEMVGKVLNHNPSYVFFRVLEDRLVVGNINVPLTPGRSIALDSRLFPKGALAFISTEKPVADDRGEIIDWTRFSRFVMNQDTGGAIRGAGRADIFWGSGPYAELAAGHLKHEGDLYILIKRP
ncbi:MAG: murein transglycosylase A [Desulfatiglandales bacterium]